MSFIVPFTKEIAEYGAFVSPNNKVIVVDHETHAMLSERYINAYSSCYDIPYKDRKQYVQEKFSLDPMLVPIDDEQLRAAEFFRRQFTLLGEKKYDFEITDYMQYILGYDKIESTKRKTITTTAPNYASKYYNYLLMDYEIVKINLITLDKTGTYFTQVDNEFDSVLLTQQQRDAEAEIEQIKQKVKYYERHLFFK